MYSFLIITANFDKIYEPPSSRISVPKKQPIDTSKFSFSVFLIQGVCSWNNNVLWACMMIEILSFEITQVFFREFNSFVEQCDWNWRVELFDQLIEKFSYERIQVWYTYITVSNGENNSKYNNFPTNFGRGRSQEIYIFDPYADKGNSGERGKYCMPCT